MREAIDFGIDLGATVPLPPRGPAAEADELIREGERALGADDMHALDYVNSRQRRLFSPDIPDPVGWLLPT